MITFSFPRWLLLIVVCCCVGGCKPKTKVVGLPEPLALPAPTNSRTDMPARFTDATESVGLQFTHQAGAYGDFFMPVIACGGACMFDYDMDGDLDLYFLDARATTPSGGESNGPAINRLFRQEDDGTFVDATEGSGLGDGSFGMGVAVGDVNNDGLPDVYLTNYGPDRLLLNTPNGVFVDVTREAGISNSVWSASATFFDYDRDGWLDLFVSNYLDYRTDHPGCADNGNWEFCGPSNFAGTPDVLFRNLGATLGDRGENGTSRALFEDVSVKSRIGSKLGKGLGVVCADFNGDEYPDIYVANDGEPNFFWISQRDGTFLEEAVLAGAAFDRIGVAQGSMGVAVADLNNDQHLDIMMTHITGESNGYYLGNEYGFEHADGGVVASSMRFTGFGLVLLDVDHDGDLDIAVANGRVKRPEGAARYSSKDKINAASGHWAPYVEQNQLLFNDGKGNFEELTSSTDALVQSRGVSRALVVGDIDNDGDLDLLETNLTGRARLLKNEFAGKGNWLSIRATDPRYGGRDAYGALIDVTAGGRSWRRLLNPGSSYLSSHDPRVHFGLGDATEVDKIEVLWPDGLRETFSGGPVNQFRIVVRGSGEEQ